MHQMHCEECTRLIIFSRVGTSERAAAAIAARAFPCAGVRAEALRSTGCSDGRSTRRDANQCAVAFFRTIDGVAPSHGAARIRFLYSRTATRLDRAAFPSDESRDRIAIRNDRLDLLSTPK